MRGHHTCDAEQSHRAEVRRQQRARRRQRMSDDRAEQLGSGDSRDDEGGDGEGDRRAQRDARPFPVVLARWQDDERQRGTRERDGTADRRNDCERCGVARVEDAVGDDEVLLLQRDEGEERAGCPPDCSDADADG